VIGSPCLGSRRHSEPLAEPSGQQTLHPRSSDGRISAAVAMVTACALCTGAASVAVVHREGDLAQARAACAEAEAAALAHAAAERACAVSATCQ
jgi:hypothetical protein